MMRRIRQNLSGKTRRTGLFVETGTILLLTLLLSGCSGNIGETITITHPAYEKKLFDTTEVKKGTLTPSVSMTLRMSKIRHIHYKVTDGGLELDRVAVSLGDKVKKGDLLISFSAEELQETLKEYQEKKKQNTLLISHYQKLQKVNKDSGYKKEIEELKKEQEITELYIREIEEKIKERRIYAKKDGTITKIYSHLSEGDVQAGRVLMVETYSSGEYKSETEGSVDLTKGMTVQAEAGDQKYKLRITKVKQKKTGKKMYYFKPVSDMRGIDDNTALTMQWEEKQVVDCVYVEKGAVSSKDGRYYVRLMDDKGYFETAEVSVGQEVGEYIVITDGLSGGEKVRVE